MAAAVLAAGRGERLGADRPKPLVEVAGRPLVDWALDAAVASGLTPVLLVVGHGADAVAARARPGVTVVRNDRFAQGQATSLAALVAHLEDTPRPGAAPVDAVCVGLADQPLVGPGAYRRLAAACGPDLAPCDLAVATYEGVRGNPVLVGRRLWAEARGLDGDAGARQLMRRHPVVEVPCDGTGDPADVDTPDDLRQVERACRSRTGSG